MRAGERGLTLGETNKDTTVISLDRRRAAHERREARLEALRADQAVSRPMGTIAYNAATPTQIEIEPDEPERLPATLENLIAIGVAQPVAEDEPWSALAVCKQLDPEDFFPEKGVPTQLQRKICLGCEVVDQCLQYALDHDEQFGIWGGKSERERRRMSRRMTRGII